MKIRNTQSGGVMLQRKRQSESSSLFIVIDPNGNSRYKIGDEFWIKHSTIGPGLLNEPIKE
jgi:hypothetical protein